MRRVVLIAVVVAVAAAACGSGDPVVANVEGTDIKESTVLEVRAIDADVVPASQFRQDLSIVVFQEIVASKLREDFDVSVSTRDAEQRLAADLEESGLTVEQAILSIQVPGASENMLVRDSYSRVLRDAAQEALAARPGFVEDILSLDPFAFATVCTSHVLVASEGEAFDVIGRLLAGADMAVVASEVSLDTGTPGGALGCASPSSYVSEFAEATVAAPVGEVFGPVETQFGFHVIVVDSRANPDAAEVAANALEFVPPEVLQNEWVNWFNEQIRVADVDIVSHIGTWFPEGPGISPPG